MARGKFITFEGPEGGGKTTQAKRLLSRLRKEGVDVLYTREPGGTRTGEAIREILQYDKAGESLAPEAEVFLFAASRAQLVRAVILPALERGANVVCDRFADSSTAYQGYGRDFGADQIIAINKFAIGAAVPDMTFLLDVPVDLSFTRLAKRHQEQFDQSDRIEREERAFHERVRQGYLDIARRYPERFCLMDGSAGASELEAHIWEVVRRVLGR
jgi:dTMP kinase